MRAILLVIATATAAVSLVSFAGRSLADETKPAADAVKLSPKQTFTKVVDALVQGDAPALRAATYTSTEEARIVVRWLEDVAKASAEARKAVLAKFGEDARKQLDAAGNAFSEKDRASMIEEIDGDSATVWLGEKEGNDPIAMRKVDGVWKLDVAEMVKQDEWKPENQAKETTAAVKRLKRFQERVTKGEVKDAKQAATWLRSAVLDADDAQPDANPSDVKEGL